MPIATQRLLRNFPDNMTGALIDKLICRNLMWCLKKLDEPTTGKKAELKRRLKNRLGILGDEFADLPDAVAAPCTLPTDDSIEEGYEGFAFKITPAITRFFHLLNSGPDQVTVGSVDNVLKNMMRRQASDPFTQAHNLLFPCAGDEIVSWAGRTVCVTSSHVYLITIPLRLLQFNLYFILMFLFLKL